MGAIVFAVATLLSWWNAPLPQRMIPPKPPHMRFITVQFSRRCRLLSLPFEHTDGAVLQKALDMERCDASEVKNVILPAGETFEIGHQVLNFRERTVLQGEKP